MNGGEVVVGGRVLDENGGEIGDCLSYCRKGLSWTVGFWESFERIVNIICRVS